MAGALQGREAFTHARQQQARRLGELQRAAAALEKHREAVEIRVCACAPVPGRSSGAGCIVIVQETECAECIGGVGGMCVTEEGVWETKGDGEELEDGLREFVGLCYEGGGFLCKVGGEERGGGPFSVTQVVLELEGFLLVGETGGGTDLRARLPAGVFDFVVRGLGLDGVREGEEGFSGLRD